MKYFNAVLFLLLLLNIGVCFVNSELNSGDIATENNPEIGKEDSNDGVAELFKYEQNRDSEMLNNSEYEESDDDVQERDLSVNSDQPGNSITQKNNDKKKPNEKGKNNNGKRKTRPMKRPRTKRPRTKRRKGKNLPFCGRKKKGASKNLNIGKLERPKNNTVEDNSENKHSDISEDEDTDISEDEDSNISEDEDSDISEDEDSNISEDEDSDISEDEDSDISEDEDSDISEDEDTDEEIQEDVSVLPIQPVENISQKNNEKKKPNETKNNNKGKKKGTKVKCRRRRPQKVGKKSKGPITGKPSMFDRIMNNKGEKKPGQKDPKKDLISPTENPPKIEN